jgi:hypothetical protein
MPPRSLELECESDPCAIRAFGARSPQRARALSPRYSSKFELGHVATNLHRLELLAERCGECERICRCSLYFIGAATKVEYRQRDDEHGYMDQRTSQAALFRTSDGLTDDGEPLLRPARLEKSKRHSGQAVERRQRVVTALGELERSRLVTLANSNSAILPRSASAGAPRRALWRVRAHLQMFALLHRGGHKGGV